jgi:hypothetical protein
MMSVQLFEQALLGLVQINQPEPPENTEFDEAWRQVEPLFRMTAGQLRKELQKQGVVSDDLLDELQVAVNTRNTLAHNYLLEYRMRTVLGASTSHEAVQEMKTVRDLYQSLTARLDALRHDIAEERGWDLDDLGGLTEEDLKRIMSEVESDEEG